MDRLDDQMDRLDVDQEADSTGQLTAYERHILELLATGMRRGEIARHMHRSPQTVSNLMTRAKDKLGARTLAEAASLVSGRKREFG
jgi:DNA-binding CsgD family transcriptional regulator